MGGFEDSGHARKKVMRTAAERTLVLMRSPRQTPYVKWSSDRDRSFRPRGHSASNRTSVARECHDRPRYGRARRRRAAHEAQMPHLDEG